MRKSAPKPGKRRNFTATRREYASVAHFCEKKDGMIPLVLV
jgi:hypothetical protein